MQNNFATNFNLQEDDRILLADMGLPMDFLQDVIAATRDQVASINPLSPNGYKGTSPWAIGTGLLRERLLAMGPHWQISRYKNDEETINTDLNFSITVKSGNAQTGLLAPPPSQKSPLGKRMQQAVLSNGVQLGLFPPDELPAKPSDARTRWFLLLNFDGEVPRAELSLPNEISANGKAFAGYHRRIIIPMEDIIPAVEFLPHDEQYADVKLDIEIKKSG